MAIIKRVNYKTTPTILATITKKISPALLSFKKPLYA